MIGELPLTTEFWVYMPLSIAGDGRDDLERRAGGVLALGHAVHETVLRATALSWIGGSLLL